LCHLTSFPTRRSSDLGSFTGTTAFTVTGNSSLTLNNVFGAQTRLNTTTAPSLTLNRGNLNLLGNPTANVAETFSTLTLNGMGALDRKSTRLNSSHSQS